MTIFVAGAPHSGTSLIAGTLANLGIFMGDTWLTDGTYEDAEFAKVETERDFIETVLKRNAKHSIWGVKFPPLYRFLWSTAYLIPNIRFIYAYRNPLTLREKYGEYAILRHLQYQGFWGHYLTAYPFPVLWMDYEQNLLYPRQALDSIMFFLDRMETDPDTYKRALAFNNGGIGYNKTYTSE